MPTDICKVDSLSLGFLYLRHPVRRRDDRMGLLRLGLPDMGRCGRVRALARTLSLWWVLLLFCIHEWCTASTNVACCWNPGLQCQKHLKTLNVFYESVLSYFSSTTSHLKVAKL
eukprot:968614-Amphidinium_carterae.1